MFFRARRSTPPKRMDREQVVSFIAARTGSLVQSALEPDCDSASLAETLDALAQVFFDLAQALRNPAPIDRKAYLIQQELERRLGVVTEFGPVRTTPPEG